MAADRTAILAKPGATLQSRAADQARCADVVSRSPDSDLPASDQPMAMANGASGGLPGVAGAAIANIIIGLIILGEERDAQAIIGAVAGLGASLDKTVVAEGIETEGQMRQVKAHGCHEGQGHFFGEPMTAETTQARFAESTSVAQLVA
jgi:hypothetical protein